MSNLKKVAIIDNYDSFTFNLVHLVEEIINTKVEVIKNDEVDFTALGSFDFIILSPGPGLPSEAGQLCEVIQQFGNTKKIFGVCLGLQAIAEVFGAKLLQLPKVYHGIKSNISISNIESPIFKHVPNPFYAGRYHSWVIDKNSDLKQLDILAYDDTGEIMAIQHKSLEIYAVQFHPESIMTDEGKQIVANFLSV
jgi:anthranilate synthase component 2